MESPPLDAPPFAVATYSYNARNQIAFTALEKGLLTATPCRNGASGLTGTANGALDNTGYTLTAGGRRTRITRNGNSEAYCYDNARQISGGTYGGPSTIQRWNQVPASNRRKGTTNGVFTNSEANSVKACTSVIGEGHVPPAPIGGPQLVFQAPTQKSELPAA